MIEVNFKVFTTLTFNPFPTLTRVRSKTWRRLPSCPSGLVPPRNSGVLRRGACEDLLGLGGGMIYSSPPPPEGSPRWLNQLNTNIPSTVLAQARGHPWPSFLRSAPCGLAPVLCPASCFSLSPPGSATLASLLLNMPDVPASGQWQWLSHLPDHSPPGAPETDSFASHKSFRVGHPLHGADLDHPYLKLQSVLPPASSVSSSHALRFLPSQYT